MMVTNSSSKCMYASQWPGPTALFHLLAVELSAVFIFLWSWRGLWHDYVVKTMLGKGYVVSRECIKDWVDKHFFFQLGRDNLFSECAAECGMTDEEKEAFTSVSPSTTFSLAMRARPIALWVPAGVAAILVTYVLVAWMLTPGAKNVGSGAYLAFTWNITQRRPYRLLLYVMLALPALSGGFLLVAWIVNISDAHRVAIEDNIPNLLVLLLTVKVMLFPNIPIHNWDSEDFNRIIFQRNFLCYTQPNGRFGVKLINALWLAQNGYTAELRALVGNEGNYGALLEVARVAESEVLGNVPVETETRPERPAASDTCVVSTAALSHDRLESSNEDVAFPVDLERPTSEAASPSPADSPASEHERLTSLFSMIALEARDMTAAALSADSIPTGVCLRVTVDSFHTCAQHAVSVGDLDTEKVVAAASGADVMQKDVRCTDCLLQKRDELMAACIDLRSRLQHVQAQRDSLKHQLLTSSEKLTRTLHEGLKHQLLAGSENLTRTLQDSLNQRALASSGNFIRALQSNPAETHGEIDDDSTELEQLRARWEILKHGTVGI